MLPCQHFSFKYTFFGANIVAQTRKNATITSYEDNLRPDGGAKSDSAVLSAFSSSKNFFGGFFHENLAEGFGMQPFPMRKFHPFAVAATNNGKRFII